MFNKENDKLKQENADLRQENAELKKQIAALEKRLDTIELEFYRNIFKQLHFNIGEVKP